MYNAKLQIGEMYKEKLSEIGTQLAWLRTQKMTKDRRLYKELTQKYLDYLNGWERVKRS